MDLHDRFDAWLVAGAEDEPPRDLAVHASGCDACLRSLAAIDSLQAIDVGGASLPPLAMAAAGRDSLAPRLRYAVGAVAVVLLGTSVAIGSSGLLSPTQLGSDPVVRSPAEGVLGGVPSPTASQPVSAQPTASPTDSPKPKQSASDESAAAVATAAPFQVLPHSTPSPQEPDTPEPTAEPPPPSDPPTATPAESASASPSIVVPTPSLTPTPSPTPTPPECSDEIDNDNDGLVDFALVGGDPGCQSADDPSEENLAPPNP